MSQDRLLSAVTVQDSASYGPNRAGLSDGVTKLHSVTGINLGGMRKGRSSALDTTRAPERSNSRRYQDEDAQNLEDSIERQDSKSIPNQDADRKKSGPGRSFDGQSPTGSEDEYRSSADETIDIDGISWNDENNPDDSL